MKDAADHEGSRAQSIIASGAPSRAWTSPLSEEATASPFISTVYLHKTRARTGSHRRRGGAGVPARGRLM